MLEFKELLKKCEEENASDLHITVGMPPVLRVNGSLIPVCDIKLTPDDTTKYAKEILGDKLYSEYNEKGEIDTSYSEKGVGRFRVNVFKQRGSDALALRVVPLQVPTLEKLNMPSIIKDLTEKTRGLILVTGPTGSGKSTTLAAMINEINNSRKCHVMTLEDPIEYLHKHKKSIINQREIGEDTKSYKNALKSALREDPDVIFIGEMRDLDTISIAITAAETGHLVLSTLHTLGASKTINRIVDVFPPHQQQQIKVQLAAVLEGVVSQQLIKKSDGKGRVCALEIMTVNSAIRNLIREGKTHQIDSVVQTSSKVGMKTMDMSLVELCKKGDISIEEAMTYAIDRDIVMRMIKL